IKLGAVLLPTTTQLGPIDLSDRVERGRAQFVVAGPEDAAKFDDVDAEVVRIVVGGEPTRQQDYAYAEAEEERTEFEPQGRSRADDLLLLYFT
ncbi:AMP-dependent synthetase, partial [Mycobacterium tuberculosis]|nr:AMP-dependent synthetase [Mycobacterium tuberculosis]